MNQAKASDQARQRFNYIGQHRYLITLLVAASQPVFTEGEAVRKVLDVLRETCWSHRFDVYAYCFLPERLVLIVRGRSDTSDMRALLKDLRTRSSHALARGTGRSLWSRRYLERVLRKTEESWQIADGIFQLPVKAGLASRPEEYPFQGSFVIKLSSPGRPMNRVSFRKNPPR